MTTLAIIVGVLTIMTVVYGANVEQLQELKGNMIKCSNETGQSPSEVTAKTSDCALTKDSQIVTYSDMGEVQKYKHMYAECARKLKVPTDELRIDTIICAAISEGDVLDVTGEYIPALSIKKLKALISDSDRLQQALEIYETCDNKVTPTGVKGIAKTMEFLVCGSHIMTLFD